MLGVHGVAYPAVDAAGLLARPRAVERDGWLRLGTHAAAAHLWAGLLALSVAVSVLCGWLLYADRVEERSIHALAPELFPMKHRGTVLQLEAFRQPDLLPVYGSSELDSFMGPYHASELFRSYPTGFEVFPMGTQGNTPLIILQSLAAVGEELRGKKVAIMVSPTFVRGPGEVRENYYGGNFSRLHALGFALNSELSGPLKQAIARRMLEYPKTLQSDPVLRFLLTSLADDSAAGRALYHAALPLGQLDGLVLRLQDHWETLRYVEDRPDLSPDVPRRPATLDWAALDAEARALAASQSASNSFGFDDDYWRRNGKTFLAMRNQNRDGTFVRSLREEMDWSDFDLLFRTLEELGAQPLMLSVPIKGVFYDYWGVSATARKNYYDKLRQAARPYNAPLVDFREFDQDRYFTADDRSHPSQYGWLHYSRALDAFYHGTLR